MAVDTAMVDTEAEAVEDTTGVDVVVAADVVSLSSLLVPTGQKNATLKLVCLINLN